MPAALTRPRLLALLVVFVAADLLFTFGQFCQLPLDGDLAPIVVPVGGYRYVLHDPFGWAVLTQNAVYSAPNRFFAHAALLGYMRYAPLALQAVVAPLDSPYLAAALYRLAVQALLLGLLGTYVHTLVGGPRRVWWLAVALVVPLFQTSGFYGQMGLVERSITYSFFYDLPLALLLLLLWPFFRAACRGQDLRPGPLRSLALAGLMVVLAFNGPVVAAAAAVLLAGLGAYWLHQRAQARRGGPPNPVSRGTGLWTRPALGLLLFFGGLCAYSLFIGRNNAENSHPYTLGQLYALLPQGVWEMLTSKLGLPLLVALVLLNAGLLRRPGVAAAPGAARVRRALRLVGLFALAYVLLLPLGGYRPYRPYLLRNDSVLPVLVALVFAYSASTVLLLRHLPRQPRRYYLAGVALVLLIFLNADRRFWLRENNTAERAALAYLAATPQPVVRLPATANVLGWFPITTPAASAANAELLHFWGITPEYREYYQ